MDYLLLICSFFYIVACGFSTIRLITPNKPITKYLRPIISLALIIHIYWLYTHIILPQEQNLSILNVLALVTFIISLLTTFASKRFNTGVLLPVIYFCSAINLIAINYLPNKFVTHLETHPQIAIHILIALLAYSILSIASLLALQLAYLDYRLKNRKFPLTKINMPPLMTLEKNLFQIILIGFILLSATLFTGFIFIDNIFSHNQIDKVIFSILAWILYATLLWGRYARGWRGRFTIYITIIGSSLLTFGYFVSRFINEIILN